MYLFVLSVDARDKICPKNVKDGVEKSVKSWGFFCFGFFILYTYTNHEQ